MAKTELNENSPTSHFWCERALPGLRQFADWNGITIEEALEYVDPAQRKLLAAYIGVRA